jgi:hypothetical protein
MLGKLPVVLALIHVPHEAEYLGRFWREILSRRRIVICRFLDLSIFVRFEGAEISLT